MSQRLARAKSWLPHAWDYLRVLVHEVGDDQLTVWAAAVSFFTIISALPLLLLAVAIAAQVLRYSQEGIDRILDAIATTVPASTDTVREVLRELMQARGTIGIIGLLSLLWTGSRIILMLEMALNIAWEATPRSFLKSQLMALGATVLFGAIGLASVGLVWLAAVARGTNYLGLEQQTWVWTIVGILVPMLLSFVMFLLLYRILPNTKVRWKSAALGALFTTIAWEVAKQGFGFYLHHLANFAYLYGSLAGLIILIIWVYYTSIIILIGAEIASLAQGKAAAKAR